jgi:hypothetical protein
MTDISNTFRFKTTIITGLKISLKSFLKFLVLNLIIFVSSIPFFLVPALIYISFENVVASLVSAGVSLLFVLILATYFKLCLVKFSINQIKQDSTKIADAFDISFHQFYRSCLAYFRIYLPAFIAVLVITAVFGSYTITNLLNSPTGAPISDITDQPVYLNQITSEAPSAILTQQEPEKIFSLNNLNTGSNIVFGLLGAISIPLAIIFTLINLLRYIFATYLILDQDLTVKESFAQAKITMYGNKLKILGFFIFNTIIFSLPLSLIASFGQSQSSNIAIIITVIVFILSIFLKNYFNLSLASIYQQLFLVTPDSNNLGNPTNPDPLPPTPIIETTTPNLQTTTEPEITPVIPAPEPVIETTNPTINLTPEPSIETINLANSPLPEITLDPSPIATIQPIIIPSEIPTPSQTNSVAATPDISINISEAQNEAPTPSFNLEIPPAPVKTTNEVVINPVTPSLEPNATTQQSEEKNQNNDTPPSQTPPNSTATF